MTEPVATVTNLDQRIHARFLAQLFLSAGLLMFVVLTLRYLLIPDVPHIPLRMLLAWVSVVLIIIPYFIARQGHIFTAGVTLIVHVMLIILAYLVLSVSQSAFQTMLAFMLLVILFASHFHTIRLTLVVAAVQLLLLFLLPLIIPVFNHSEMLKGPIPFHIVLTSMVVLFAYYRRRIEQAQRSLLAESETRFRMVSELIPNYAFSVQIEKTGLVRQEWVTDKFAQMTGYALTDIDENFNAKLFHPEDLPRYLESVEQSFKGKATSGEYRIVTKSGEVRWLRISRNVVWNTAENRLERYYGVAQDVTAQKQAENQQLDLMVQEERSRLVRDFVTAFSHDFRTSLATIETSRYLAERLMQNARSDEAAVKLSVIRKAVTHMSAQLENLNAIATLTNLQRRPTDLNQLLADVVTGYMSKAQQHNQLMVFQPNSYVPVVMADAEELRRAFRELVRNALSFTDEEGVITITTALANREVRVSIRDTGIGIAAVHLDHIFDLFYRVDSARGVNSGGVGLGLSVARMIVAAHNGTITVKSKPDEGSTFIVSLPLEVAP